MPTYTYDPTQMKQFEQWLEANGAEVRQTTNEWECVRFRANGVTGVVYRNKRGILTFVGESWVPWSAFLDGAEWTNLTPPPPPPPLVQRLRDAAEDPMWANHAEISKGLLREAATEIDNANRALDAIVKLAEESFCHDPMGQEALDQLAKRIRAIKETK